MKPVTLLVTAALAGLAATVPAAAWAKDYQVKMLNSGKEGTMVFEPAFLKVATGDTVTFQPADPGHNAESIPTMLPAGATPFKGAFSKPVTVTFTKPGLYGYKCLPHYTLGMVGLVQVGAKPDKAGATAAAAQLPGLARMRMTTLIAAAR